MGRARMIRSRDDLADLHRSSPDAPFWTAQHSPADEQDLVLVLVGGSDPLNAEDVPGCGVAVVSASPVRSLAIRGRTPPPCVADLGTGVQTIRDGELVLVDGARGEVLVDPTDRAVSAFQARLTGLMPSRRYFVDYAHETVRTPDGRLILVGGMVSQGIESADGPSYPIEEAVASGPDLIIVEAGCDAGLIGDLTPAAHGKPLLFRVHPEGCCEEALIRAGAWGDITVATPIGPRGAAVHRFRESLEAATETLVADGLETGPVRVAGWTREGIEEPAWVAESSIERLVVEIKPQASRPGTLLSPWLEEMLDAARSIAVPLYVAMEPSRLPWAADAVEAGIGGVFVPWPDVQPWKSALRTAAYADWQ